MKRATELLQFILIFVYMAMGRKYSFEIGPMRDISLLLFIAVIPTYLILRHNQQLSDISLALLGYLVVSFFVFWAAPAFVKKYLAMMPVPILYAVVLLMVALPPFFGRKLFTYHFSRQSASEAFQQTDAFRRLNQQMTAFWITIFAINICVSLIPNIFVTLENQRLFTLFIPMGMLLGVGVPVTKFYPEFQEKKALRTLNMEIAEIG